MKPASCTFWGCTGCAGLFIGFFIGAAMGITAMPHGDGDTRAFNGLFWAVGAAPLGGAIFLAIGAAVRAVLEPPPGQRPAPGQIAAAAGIVLVAVLCLFGLLSHTLPRASKSATSATIVTATPTAPPPSLGPLIYPGMHMVGTGPGSIIASTSDSLEAVRSYFTSTTGIPAADCSASTSVCSRWTAQMPTGARVTITAQARTQHSALVDDSGTNPPPETVPATTGPVTINYTIGSK